MSDTQPPLAYLLECSNASLESFELSRLNRASNLQKEQSQLTEERIEAEVSLRLARWILDHRRQEATSSELLRSDAGRFAHCTQLTLALVAEPECAPEAKQIDCALSRVSEERSDLVDSRAPARRVVVRKKASAKRRWLERQMKAHFETLMNQSHALRTNLVASRVPSYSVSKATVELCALDDCASGPPEAHSRFALALTLKFHFAESTTARVWKFWRRQYRQKTRPRTRRPGKRTTYFAR